MAPRPSGHNKRDHGATMSTQLPPLFNTIISAVQFPEGLKPVLLKRLYAALVQMSLSEPQCWFINGSALTSLDKNGKFFKEICDLSNILFKELGRRFEELLHASGDVSAGWGSEGANLNTDVWAMIQVFNLLLRSCMVMLIVIAAFDQSFILKKGQVLLSILSRLISIQVTHRNEKSSITFKKLLTCEHKYHNYDFTASVTEEFVALSEHSHPFYSFLYAALEVFADELLLHESLREHFMFIDAASSRDKMLFSNHFVHENIGCVLEVICAHFILLFSDELAFENLLSRLVWCHQKDFRVPEMSLSTALSLLLNPIMFSAPKMFQAYLILLVSEAIGIWRPSEDMRADVKLTDCYPMAFEMSVILYSRHMSNMHIDDGFVGGDCYSLKSCMFGSTCGMTFESFVQPVTRDKMYKLIDEPKNSWDLHLSSISFGAKSDLVDSSVAYVKENLHIFDESCQDEILSFLNCIIFRCSSGDFSNGILLRWGKTSPADICLLASILKLMSSSMLQATWYLRHHKFSGCPKSLEDYSSCNAILDIADCFEQFSIHLPIQNYLCEMMQSLPARHKVPKWMLLHFSGLLSLCYDSGLDFLVKDCLFIIMVVLNLFHTKGDGSSALASFFGSKMKSFSSKPSENMEQVVQKSSQIISSKIQKFQVEHLSMVEDKKTCNGEEFLKCIIGKSGRSSDLDDLADFIECRQGKDYGAWLRGRQKYRQWRYRKLMTLRWNKKRMNWKHVKRS